MVLAYANIAMSIFERNLLVGSCSKPLVWFRYTDDIFVIWTYREGKFKDFLFYINSMNSSFQFTCNYSKECVQFFFMSDFLNTIMVTLQQICLSNLLTRTNAYWLLVVILTILIEAYLTFKRSVYFVFVLAKNQPSYVVLSLWTAW